MKKETLPKPHGGLWDSSHELSDISELESLSPLGHVKELGKFQSVGSELEADLSRAIQLERGFVRRFIRQGVLPAIRYAFSDVDTNGAPVKGKDIVVTRFLTPDEITRDVRLTVEEHMASADLKFSSAHDPWDAVVMAFGRTVIGPSAMPLGAIKIHDVDLNPGLIPITGPAKIGKSRLLVSYARDHGIPILVVNEPRAPRDPVLDDGLLNYVASYTEAFTIVIARAAICRVIRFAPWVVIHKGWEEEEAKSSLPPAVSIDSLREFIWTIPGSLGSRGLPNMLGSALTRISNLFADLGITVLAAINPSYRDAEFTARFDDVVTESVSAFIKIGAVADAATNLVIEQRPERAPTMFGSIPGHDAESTEKAHPLVGGPASVPDHIPHDGMTITFDQEI